jgi:hypothetical protein
VLLFVAVRDLRQGICFSAIFPCPKRLAAYYRTHYITPRKPNWGEMILDTLEHLSSSRRKESKNDDSCGSEVM